jgi:hypothetical protein
MEVELLSQIRKVLARWIADVSPNYVLRILAKVTDVRHRTVFCDFLRDGVEAGNGNQSRSLPTARVKIVAQCITTGKNDAAEEKPI